MNAMAARASAAVTRHAAGTLVLVALALMGLAWVWPGAAQAAPSEEGKIAFTRSPDAPSDIWVMNPDGSDETPLTGNRELSDFGVAWSPDGQRIAFARQRRDDTQWSSPDIYVMNADGSALARLTREASQPTWSPDGQRIAFVRARSDVDRPSFRPLLDIWVINPDGSDETPLTDNREVSDDGVAWSPDGERIAFTREREIFGDTDIWVMNADGSEQARLTTGESPAWSPDGERIAFTSKRQIFRDADIWVMNPDGSDQTRLTRLPPKLGFRPSPAWSPDGERIAFAIVEERDDWRVEYIYVMYADGSGLTRTRDALWPAWSPDGQRIAFQRPHFPGDIWAMDADAGCQTHLTKGPALDSRPTWQPLSPPSGSRACFTLSVSVSGSGTGRVTGPAIHCVEGGDECTASFAEGTDLTLTARSARGSGFSAWDGACTGTGPCELTMNGDRQVSATFGKPSLRVRARPRQRRVGPNKRRVRYRLVVRNVGDGPSGTVNLCARGSQRRVRILGKRCVTRSIPPGARRQRPVRVRIRPAARGKLTRIRLVARGPNVQNRRTVARLRVRR